VILRLKYVEAELSFEKEADGSLLFDGVRIRPDNIEGFKEFLCMVLQELGVSTSSGSALPD
jgi:hypothetical protein